MSYLLDVTLSDTLPIQKKPVVKNPKNSMKVDSIETIRRGLYRPKEPSQVLSDTEEDLFSDLEYDMQVSEAIQNIGSNPQTTLKELKTQVEHFKEEPSVVKEEFKPTTVADREAEVQKANQEYSEYKFFKRKRALQNLYGTNKKLKESNAT
mmetsp:Transcript_9546/g.14220  ORF Transcript_9546/g.14220 Transcript_9546/m.14220 type:complete len:151 (+) Transcript_9546:1034-1486(+)